MSWFVGVKNMSFEIPSGRKLKTVERVDFNEYRCNSNANSGNKSVDSKPNIIYSYF